MSYFLLIFLNTSDILGYSFFCLTFLSAQTVIDFTQQKPTNICKMKKKSDTNAKMS